MSMTRQSLHILRRSAAAPWKAAWRAGLPMMDSMARKVPKGLPADAAAGLGFMQQTRALARLAAVGQPQPRLQGDGVFRAGAGAQTALHAVFLDEAQLRLLGVVSQRGFRAGADAVQAQRALVGVDQQVAERRAWTAKAAMRATVSAGAARSAVSSRDGSSLSLASIKRRCSPG